jgi:5'-3' exonuclease
MILGKGYRRGGRPYSFLVGNLTLLVDTASLTYRALFSVPDTVKAEDGTPMNAAYGFLGMLETLIARYDPDFLCCALDEDWRPTWRVELLEAYKSKRAEPGSAQEQAEERLAPQVPVLFEVLEGCGIALLGHPDYEAEDVIGTLAQTAPGKVAIVSGDRDLFQLVRDPDIEIIYPRRGVSQVEVVNESYVEEHYKIPGRRYRDFALLRGDPSDGLPGVRGVGEKQAAVLVSRFGSLEELMEAAREAVGGPLAKVRADLDYLERAVEVVTIPTDLPLKTIDLTRPRSEPNDEILELAERNGLSGAVRRLVAALTNGAR